MKEGRNKKHETVTQEYEGETERERERGREGLNIRSKALGWREGKREGKRKEGRKGGRARKELSITKKGRG